MVGPLSRRYRADSPEALLSSRVNGGNKGGAAEMLGRPSFLLSALGRHANAERDEDGAHDPFLDAAGARRPQRVAQATGEDRPQAEAGETAADRDRGEGERRGERGGGRRGKELRQDRQEEQQRLRVAEIREQADRERAA